MALIFKVLMFSGVDLNNLDVMYEGLEDLFSKGTPTKENILEIMAAPKSVREKKKKKTTDEEQYYDPTNPNQEVSSETTNEEEQYYDPTNPNRNE